MLQLSRWFILTFFPIIWSIILLFFCIMIQWLSECVRWIYQCMFHIKWLHFISIKWSILLQSLSECWLEHIFITSHMLWISKWAEWIYVFNLKLVQIRHWHRWPIARLNSGIWWISEMVILIEQIRRFKKTLFLWLI